LPHLPRAAWALSLATRTGTQPHVNLAPASRSPCCHPQHRLQDLQRQGAQWSSKISGNVKLVDGVMCHAAQEGLRAWCHHNSCLMVYLQWRDTEPRAATKIQQRGVDARMAGSLFQPALLAPTELGWTATCTCNTILTCTPNTCQLHIKT